MCASAFRASLLLLAALLPAACTPPDAAETRQVAPYFTVPSGGPIQATSRPQPAPALAAAIDQAQQTVRFCMFRLDHEQVVAALLRAHDRGVQVRVVTDQDHDLAPWAESFRRLQQRGIEVRADHTGLETVLHHKFAVLDGQKVWTGDWNAHTADSDKACHTALLIASKNLARTYADVFEALWRGAANDLREHRPDASGEAVQLPDGVRVRAWFPPADAGDVVYADAVRAARVSVCVAHTYFYSRRLVGELAAAAARGVAVKVLYQNSAPGLVDTVLLAGGDARTGGSYVGCKFLLVDDATLVVGSWNAGTEDTDLENIVRVDGDEAVVRDYRGYFDKQFDAAKAHFQAPVSRWVDAAAMPPAAKALAATVTFRADGAGPAVAGLRVDGSGLWVELQDVPGDGSFAVSVYTTTLHSKKGPTLDPGNQPLLLTAAGKPVIAQFHHQPPTAAGLLRVQFDRLLPGGGRQLHALYTARLP